MDTKAQTRETVMHEETIRLLKKLHSAHGDMNTVHFRPSEIESLALNMGFKRHMPQLTGAEWFASLLADAGKMPKMRASILDPDSRFLTFKNGMPVPMRSSAEYVAPILNELLANGGTALKSTIKHANPDTK